MKRLICLLLIITSPLTASQLSGFDAVDFDRPPHVVLGPENGHESEILGNGGEPYGADFARIIYIDVFQFLKDQFLQNKIAATHPLYVLKPKMARFESLLQEQDRVIAVSRIIDSAGHEVLARVVPKRSQIVLTSEENGIVTRDEIAVEFDGRHAASNTWGLRVLESKMFSEISFAKISPGLSSVRLGARPVTTDGVLLPAGARFYAVCDSDSTDDWQTAASVNVVCGGFNLEGATATIQGTLKRNAQGVLNGKLQVLLYIQKYCIEVNQAEFVRLQTRAPKSTLERLVFHEYLRLLGVDDNSNKLSMQFDDLRNAALTVRKFPYAGARVLVPAGAEILSEKNGSILRYSNPPRTKRARFGVVRSVYDLQFGSSQGTYMVSVLRVNYPEAAGVESVMYHMTKEVKAESTLEVSP